MLLEHYKLEVQPFGVTPDPRFLYFGNTHREAMGSLIHGAVAGRGFVSLIAEPGMGKTTLLFNFLQMLKSGARTAFLFQSYCAPKEFLRSLLADLGIADSGRDVSRMSEKLNACALHEAQQGRQLVVVVDEAQNLKDEVLETVRMLSNFETPDRKLMHVVLAGQPQLAEKLASENLVQLRQRISIIARLKPFNAVEVREYIEHRLYLAGYRSQEPLFSPQAYSMIAEYSRGIPRNINNLCFNALALGCAMNRPTLDASILEEVINDLALPVVPTERFTAQKNQASPAIAAAENAPTKKFKLRTILFGRGKAAVAASASRHPAVVALILLALMGFASYRAGDFLGSRQTQAERHESLLQQGDNRDLSRKLVSSPIASSNNLPQNQIQAIPSSKQPESGNLPSTHARESIGLVAQRENP